jgi:hypothetical protein
VGGCIVNRPPSTRPILPPDSRVLQPSPPEAGGSAVGIGPGKKSLACKGRPGTDESPSGGADHPGPLEEITMSRLARVTCLTLLLTVGHLSWAGRASAA